jgi:hypothetical protein
VLRVAVATLAGGALVCAAFLAYLDPGNVLDLLALAGFCG